MRRGRIGFSPRNELTSLRFLSLNDLPRDIAFAWLIEPTVTRSERTPGS
jgi:hypothetical protein